MDARSALLRRKHFSEWKNTFVSSAMGVQRDDGVSVPLGVVATATIKLNKLFLSRYQVSLINFANLFLLLQE
jgi:hypothetical protein